MSVSLFDYCTNRCRVNGRSTAHENSYRTQAHHCFGQHGHPNGVKLNGIMPVDDGHEHIAASHSSSAQGEGTQESLLEYSTVEEGDIALNDNFTTKSNREVCRQALSSNPFSVWEQVICLA